MRTLLSADENSCHILQVSKFKKKLSLIEGDIEQMLGSEADIHKQMWWRCAKAFIETRSETPEFQIGTRMSLVLCYCYWQRGF